MSAVYQQCPFCERVFELGPTEYEPMNRHIRIAHANDRGQGADAESNSSERSKQRLYG